jgi:hypothetical protein
MGGCSHFESLLTFENQDLRDRLTRTKHSRDALRAANQQLRQDQGFINSDRLVLDFETRKLTLDDLDAQIATLNQRLTGLQRLIDAGSRLEDDPVFAARSTRLRLASSTLSHSARLAMGAGTLGTVGGSQTIGALGGATRVGTLAATAAAGAKTGHSIIQAQLLAQTHARAYAPHSAAHRAGWHGH